jgi:hypothetical protein
VTDLDKINTLVVALLLKAIDRSDDSVDAIARIPVYASHTPRGKTLDQEITNRGHEVLLLTANALDMRRS